MQLVFLTALGVGGATLFGTILGFVFKNLSHKFSDIVLSFAAGVMLSAAVIGLVLPSLEYGGKFGLVYTIAGVFAGALCVNLFDRLVPHLHQLSGADNEEHPADTAKRSKVILFVAAIAIHNLPEGLAAGVGFGTGCCVECKLHKQPQAAGLCQYHVCRQQQGFTGSIRRGYDDKQHAPLAWYERKNQQQRVSSIRQRQRSFSRISGRQRHSQPLSGIDSTG